MIARFFPPSLEQHIDNGEVLRTVLPIENADMIGKMLLEERPAGLDPMQKYTTDGYQMGGLR
ncbi:MAG: hypothetical protein IPM58_18515 [Nitrospira sp.]|nr:hypothetical protein [Nitrospira sp.]